MLEALLNALSKIFQRSRSSFDQSIIVAKSSIESDDPHDVVQSNVAFLNALLDEQIAHDELARDGMRSYYVDYYLAQVGNGGFSQFVYNSGWEKNVVQYVLEGLGAMGATRHLELFEQSASIIDRIGPEGMERFFDSEFFGKNEERDVLSEFDDRFWEVSEQEDLIKLNSEWLKKHPSLVVMADEEIQAEVERRAAALPDRASRVADALEGEPRYMKLIRALCAEAGHELERVTAGDPVHEHDGQQVMAWHFITDKGHHYMVDLDSKASMFDGDSDEQIVEIEASDRYGPE